MSYKMLDAIVALIMLEFKEKIGSKTMHKFLFIFAQL